jgi:DNA primase
MSGRIPQSFIDELLSRTDIVDIIDSVVSLRKGGKNFLGLCPFHDEKTPSFTVSPDKQFYHCFGCGANGTAITFLMEYNRMEFIEAIEDLASKAGLVIPHEAGPSQNREGFSEFYELMELIVGYYRDQLKKHPDAKRPVDYLKQRGITGELASRFELGYAPPGWDNLLGKFGSSKDAEQRLEKLGMIIVRSGSGGYYDRFRDRIIYPIRDHRGRAIGFGGRTLGDDTPKYLNSPETPIFHKGRELYGLTQARQLASELDRMIVVEGYMDVLALAQYEVDNVVATLGVAASTDHLNRMFRHVNQVVFCFDGDEAGRNAAWRAMEIALPFLHDGRQAFFLFMPEGSDPDDYVRQEGAEFFNNTSNYVPLSDYLLETLKGRNDLSTREGRSRLVDQATPYIGMLPQGALRQLLLADLAAIAKIPTSNIEPLVPKAKKLTRNHTVMPSLKGRSRTPVTILIELLLFRPGLASLIEDTTDLKEIPHPGADFLREVVDLIHSRPDINCAGIIENWRDTKFEARLRQIAADSDERVSALEDPEKELLDTLRLLQRHKERQFRQKLTNLTAVSDLSEEQKEHLRQAGKHPDLSSKK